MVWVLEGRSSNYEKSLLGIETADWHTEQCDHFHLPITKNPFSIAVQCQHLRCPTSPRSRTSTFQESLSSAKQKLLTPTLAHWEYPKLNKRNDSLTV